MKNMVKGISLIVLIITIIIIIIIASAVILSIINNNPILNANETKVKADMSALKDEYNSYNKNLIFANNAIQDIYDKNSLNVDLTGHIVYEGKTNDYRIEMLDMLPSIKGSIYENKIFIAKDKIYIDNRDKILSENQKKWIKETGVNVLDDGVILIINKEESNIIKGRKEQLYVSSLPEPTNLNWTSSNPLVASVDSNGTVIGLESGTTIVTAYSSDGKSKIDCKINVINKNVSGVEQIVVEPNQLEIGILDTYKLNAKSLPSNMVNNDVIWSTSNSSIATVSDEGYVTGKAVGDVIITATTKDGKLKGYCNVRVKYKISSISLNKEFLTLKQGLQETLIATVEPSGYSGEILWHSDDETIASVDNNGKVTANKIGRTIITAMTEDGTKSASCNVEVTDPLELTASINSITSDTINLNINSITTYGNITTIQIKRKVANTLNYITSTIEINDKIYNSKYNITSLLPSTNYDIEVVAIITGGENKKINLTAKTKDIKASSVKLNKSQTSIVLGNAEKLFATVLPENTTDKTVKWYSSNENVATVTQDGVVTSKNLGTTIITVISQSDSSKMDTCVVTVVDAVARIGNVYYHTLQDAFEASSSSLSSPSDIYILKSINENTIFKNGRNANLYLQGYTISSDNSSQCTLTNNGTLNIYGFGVVSSSENVAINNIGILSINNETNITSTASAKAAINNTGNVILNDGIVNSIQSLNSNGINNLSTTSRLTINYGNITGYTNGILNYGTIIMEDGNIKGQNGNGIGFFGGDTNIINGNIEGNYGIYAYTSSNNKNLILGNNTDSVIAGTESPKITGTLIGVNFENINTFKFFDGIVIGNPPLDKTDTSDIITPDGYMVIVDDITAKLGKIATIDDIAEIRYNTNEYYYGKGYLKYATTVDNNKRLSVSSQVNADLLNDDEVAPTMLVLKMSFYDKDGNELKKIHNVNNAMTMEIINNNAYMLDSSYSHSILYGMPSFWIGVESLEKKVMCLDYYDSTLDTVNNKYIRFNKKGTLPEYFSTLNIYLYMNPIKTSNGQILFSYYLKLYNNGEGILSKSMVTTSNKTESVTSSTNKKEYDDIVDIAKEKYKKYFK